MTRMSKQVTHGVDIYITRSFYALHENVHYKFFNAYVISDMKSRIWKKA